MEIQSKVKSFGAYSLFMALHAITSAQALPNQGTAAVKFGVVKATAWFIYE